MLSSASRRAGVRVAALVSLTLPLLACPVAPSEGGKRVGLAAAPATENLHAVLLSGGRRRENNYYSHLEHLRSALALLRGGGVESARISVFAGDGPDPTPDLATREGELHPDFWLLPPRPVGALLRPPIVYVNSELDGLTLRPAKHEELRRWFENEGSQLVPGDTLLFYVTDHGQKNREDLTDNTIALWGENLSVRQLEELLVLLDPGVRVVMFMSQCYSGSFANAIFSSDAALPAGNVCGYFSTLADRQASGCYPEVSGKEGLGHSNRMFRELASGRALADAHREVLVTDTTPDVPVTTSSFFLEQRLAESADAADREYAAFVDELLAEALKSPRDWEGEIRLLDRLGRAFGFASPRSLAALDEQVEALSELSETLKTYADRWERTLGNLRSKNLESFLAEDPSWSARLKPELLKTLTPEARQAETEELLSELVAFTKESPERDARLRDLHWKTEEAKAARYRAEVRLGVVLRMRALLTQVAGRLYLRRHATEAERSASASLDACEDLAFGSLPDPSLVAVAPPEPFPTLEEERERLEALAPAWLGIRFGSPRAAERTGMELPAGAVVVRTVYPDSPAEQAQIHVSDILLGPPGEPFSHPQAVSGWTAQGEIGKPVPLRLLRNGREIQVTLRLAPFPVKLPGLPGPPKIGSAGPPLRLQLVRGEALEPEGPQLLFFWATWCSFCKHALPELAAFEKARGLPVVAITDETPDEIETFYREHPGPLPEIVASDRQRLNFQRFGVSGTPTFVLMDEDGIVRHYWSGYDVAKGLEVDGWRWNGAPAK